MSTSSTCTLLISALTLLISSVISHPFFFLSLILLFPYLVKLLSFLSPLFITTSLLLTAFLTISATESSKGAVSFLHSAYQAVLLKLQPKTEDEDLQSLETLQVYRTVFELPLIIDGQEENPEEKILQAVESSVVKKTSSHDRDGSVTIHEDLTSELESESESESGSGNSEKLETIKSEVQGKRISDFLNDKCEMESSDFSVEDKKVEPAGNSVDKAVNQENKELSLPPAAAAAGNEIDSRTAYFPKIKSHSQRIITTTVEEYPSRDWKSRSIEYDLGRYGSMRREKEWKRTLACKLFEERHHNNNDDDKDAADTGEGMDSLWEAYEMQSSGTDTKKKDKDNKSKTRIKEFVNEQDEDDEEEQEDEDDEGQLCCLQALKFSAGKMNMGVGRRNFAKFSKAVKGFGWLHHVSRTHRKKVVHNGDS